MADDDVILYIYPSVGNTGNDLSLFSINLPENKFAQEDREPTETADEHDLLDYLPCIRLRFADVPKTRHGLIAGWSPNADLRLLKVPGVGYLQLSFTFNNDYLPVIRDLGSTCGTSVMYAGDNTGARSNFDWIIGGHSFLSGRVPIIVKVSHLLQFQIVVPQHDITSQAYRDKVDRFRAGNSGPPDLQLLGELDLGSRQRTEMPSGTTTPTKGSVAIKDWLGEGSFAVVHRVWNVSTGEEHAVKEAKRGFDVDMWKEEAAIMKRISHKHIVALLKAEFTPTPRLRLEYVPGQSLQQQLAAGRPFSARERKQILCQALSALEYLHGLDPPIVHRDIGTGNMLIKYRNDKGVFVQFSDFGMSTQGDHLKTICGTPKYLAPEIWKASAVSRGLRSTYTKAVDIWSLGVVLAELAPGLPKWKKEHSSNGTRWCEDILSRLNDWLTRNADGVATFLLQSMLHVTPGARASAQECHREALFLSVDAGPREDHGDGSERGQHEHEHGTARTADATRMIRPRRGVAVTSRPGMNGEPRQDSNSLEDYVAGLTCPNRGERSAAPPPDSPRAPPPLPVRVGEIMDKFVDPLSSLFVRSSFGSNYTLGFGTGILSEGTATARFRQDASEKLPASHAAEDGQPRDVSAQPARPEDQCAVCVAGGSGRAEPNITADTAEANDMRKRPRTVAAHAISRPARNESQAGARSRHVADRVGKRKKIVGVKR